jgi:hypothetical protein
MITKPFILAEDKYRIGVLILRDHGRRLETGASLIPRVPECRINRHRHSGTFTIDAGGARANGVSAGLNGVMANIEDFRRLVAGDHGLVVVSVTRTDGTISSSVVNAGVLPHPATGETVVGMVIRGGTRKLAYLRERPYANVVIRSGWQWAAAEGAVDLIGPDDPEPSVDPERLRLLLREVFTAAGGTHDDFAAYDRVMRDERRTAVFVHPARVYANPGQ